VEINYYGKRDKKAIITEQIGLGDGIKNYLNLVTTMDL